MLYIPNSLLSTVQFCIMYLAWKNWKIGETIKLNDLKNEC